ncbi:MAG: hypothetical protein IH884_07475, partial [Myxococcales bacterium]|nr:hypothetical protein [Myxococcales bacterium]
MAALLLKLLMSIRVRGQSHLDPDNPGIEGLSSESTLLAVLMELSLGELKNFKVRGQFDSDSEKSDQYLLSQTTASTSESDPDHGAGLAAPASHVGGAEFTPFDLVSLVEAFSLVPAYVDELDGGTGLDADGLVADVAVTENFEFPEVDPDENSGAVDATPATATITVTPVNDAPTSDTVAASGAEDATSIPVTLT